MRISPIWLTSKTPTAVRTAKCSAISPEYSTGMSHPPKSTIFAPIWRWTWFNAVLRSVVGASVIGANGFPLHADGLPQRRMCNSLKYHADFYVVNEWKHLLIAPPVRPNH